MPQCSVYTHLLFIWYYMLDNALFYAVRGAWIAVKACLYSFGTKTEKLANHPFRGIFPTTTFFDATTHFSIPLKLRLLLLMKALASVGDYYVYQDTLLLFLWLQISLAELYPMHTFLI